jgi:hypothetical protein
MAKKKLNDKWRYFHCADLGVRGDYCVLQYRFADDGWTTVATCHPAAIPVLKADGVRAHIDLIKVSPAYRRG